METAVGIKVATAATVIFSAPTAPQKELVTPITNVKAFPKPLGGFWTTPKGEQTWTQWCEYEDWSNWREHNQYELTTTRPVKVAVIDCLDDLDAILDEYGYKVEGFGRGKWFINFEAMAADGWDGVWLTNEGQWKTRLSSPSNLYGWDVSSIVWFTWPFDN
jgi:hypothetical protein